MLSLCKRDGCDATSAVTGNVRRIGNFTSLFFIRGVRHIDVVNDLGGRDPLAMVVRVSDEKVDLVESLRRLNEAVLGKVGGLEEYDLRRPLTATGTNLLGIVKHLGCVQSGYFGDVFGRPWTEPMPWLGEGAEINADMFATAAETSDQVVDLYRRSWVHAEQTFAVTDLDDTGMVAWWPPERRHPTLRTVLLHMTVETARHAGHIDIIREMVDGEAGRFAGDPSMPASDEIDWPAYVAKVEAAALAASTGS